MRLSQAMTMAALLALGATGCARQAVEPGQRGLRYDPHGGGVKPEVLQPGSHGLGWCFMRDCGYIETYDITYQTRKEALFTPSSEGLAMDVRVTVMYRPVVSELFQLHTEVGRDYYESLTVDAVDALVDRFKAMAPELKGHHYIEGKDGPHVGPVKGFEPPRPGAGKGCAPRHPLTLQHGLAMAHHHRRHMGKRRKVARGTDRPLCRDHRQDALGQHAFDQGDQRGPHPRRAAAQRQKLQRQDQPHDAVVQRIADAAAMRQDQVALKRCHIAPVDAD